MDLQHTSGKPWRVVNMQSSEGSDAVVWIVEVLIGRLIPGSPAGTSSRLSPTAKSSALARDSDWPRASPGSRRPTWRSPAQRGSWKAVLPRYSKNSPR